MPRPRPTTDQHQHIIRCDDKLWTKIVNAATKSTADSINAYVNRVMEWAMAFPHPHILGDGGATPGINAIRNTTEQLRATGVLPPRGAANTAQPASTAPTLRSFSKADQVGRTPKGSGRPPKKAE